MEWVRVVIKGIGWESHVAVCLLQALLLTTIFTDLGYLHSLYNLYGEIADPLAAPGYRTLVISGYSLAPFTSIVDVNYVEDLAKSLSGVKAVVYETLAVVYLNTSSVTVRGIRSEDLALLTNYTIISGVAIDGGCPFCAWVGSALAREYNISVGSLLTIYSPFTQSPFILRVRGIIDAGDPYSHEIIVPLELGRAIRGIGGGQASLAVIILEPWADPSMVARALNMSLERVSLLERIMIAVRYSGGKAVPSTYSSVSEPYLARLGLHRELFLTATISIAFLLSIGSYMLGRAPLTSNSEKLRVLYMQGLSPARIKGGVILLLQLYLAIAALFAWAAANYIAWAAGLHILGYPLRLGAPGYDVIAAVLCVAIFTSLGAATVVIDEESPY